MKIQKFSIKKYRAIEEIDFNLNYSINPIIGINEAGKTSILKAILAFDSTRDKYNNGEHLDFKNKYLINEKTCTISAYFNFDKSELKELVEYLKLSTDSEDYKIINSFTKETVFKLNRNLSTETKDYSIEIEGLNDKILEKFKKFTLQKLPYILYFDDFADRVPEEINFPADYITNKKLGRSKDRDWQEIIEEIFKRADTEDFEDNDSPLISYLKVTNKDTKEDILSDVEDTLNKEIINEWKRIKKSGTKLADDSEKLELVISNEGNKFSFKVKDKSNQDKKRTFDISERSKGFQWFFNYMIKLKFNPNYKGKSENSLFLLDEPGSYLHSSAQSELLKELHSVSSKNTIIYCTHSQYLLNPELIKLGSIKIAEKKDSVATLKNFGEYKTKNDRGALSPIYQALNLNFTNDFIGKIIITEGITDFYFFGMLHKHTKLIKNNVKIIPSSGASQSTTLLSVTIAFSDNFLLLLDNDKAGKSAEKSYKKEFGDSIANHFHFYKDSKEDFVLEDFMCKNDQKKLLELTKSDNLKRAMSFLYYDYKDFQNEFFSKLSKETLSNLESTLERINSI